MRRILAAAAVLALAAGAAPALADHHAESAMPMDHAAHHALMAALAADVRADDRARDAWRHPFETLTFFGVEPGMTVVDYMPASGWYTRILVPYLGENGSYIGLSPDPAAADSTGFKDYLGRLPAQFAENYPGWGLSGASVTGYSSADIPEDAAGTVDRVLVFREMHNLLRSGTMYTELTRIRGLLKDDGMLGIVQHRAKSAAPADYTLGTRGYLRQDDVIALVEAHGFELVGMSEINANPADPADWENGVWTLPPSNRGDLAEAAAVGESDRMTLLFRKR